MEASVMVDPPERHQTGPQVLAERGAEVEILGLAQWTPAMLLDSLRVHAPEVSLPSPRMAEVLQERLGFPDAIAVRQSGDSAVSILVAVIEPHDSARIRRRRFDDDYVAEQAPWPQLVRLARTQLRLWGEALEAPVYARTVGLSPSIPIALRPDSNEVRRLWAALEAHRSAEDVAAARRMLTSSPDVDKRLAAVAVLSAFERQDAAWHALVGALLDPDPGVRLLAGRVLRAFSTQAPRKVDWRPAFEDLHSILDGSALSALFIVLDALVATGAGPECAEPLLRQGGHAVLMFAEATSPSVRLASHRFLRSVHEGPNLMDVDAWRAWTTESDR